MDKRWMDFDNRQHPKYVAGVNNFLDFAFSHAARGDKIRCPCYKCVNGIFQTREVVFGHLILHGILKDYKWWSCHGEEYQDQSNEITNNDNREPEEESCDEMHELSQDLNPTEDINDSAHSNFEEKNESAKKCYQLLMDAKQELTPEQIQEQEQKSEYMRLWKKVKRKRDENSVDKNVENVYKRMKELHGDQFRRHGKDTLSGKQAYKIVFGHRSSYIHGMGPDSIPFESGDTRGQKIRAQIRAETEQEMVARIQLEVEERMSQSEKKFEARITEMQTQLRTEMQSHMRSMMEQLSQIELPVPTQQASTEND